MLIIERVMRLIEAARSVDELALAMAEIADLLGFEHFALSHHVDLRTMAGGAVSLHNYPVRWADYYEQNALGVSDPVHRASHVTSFGFRWGQLGDLVTLSAADRRMLALGRDQGIGDGYTVPANVPGEARGSCSFANRAGRPLDERMLPLAQLAGAFAFEAARRLLVSRPIPHGGSPMLTDRQRDCVLWVARGKGDWEIGRILGVSEETVARHIKQACERYGVSKRTSLVIRALFEGTLTFFDIFRR